MALTTSKILRVFSDFKNGTGPYIVDSKIILKTARKSADLDPACFRKFSNPDMVDLGFELSNAGIENLQPQDEQTDDSKINFVV
ncbi:MAG: hypothetical protein IKU37_02110 [Candidatus Gastranaerophilales bacterium]|nr:hypothetical protein [Candidatus Gastranaerophilales bacterium]